MASALYSGLRDRGLIPGHDCCVVYLGKTVYSYSASRHLGVQIGIGKLWERGGGGGGTCTRWSSITSRGSKTDAT